MKVPTRLLCVVLSLSLCCPVWAQNNAPSLSQLQKQAQNQVKQNPWVKNWLLPTALSATTGAGIWLMYKNTQAARLLKQKDEHIRQIQEALQDTRYEVKSLRAQRASLVTQRDNALKLWEQTEKLLNKQKPPKILPSAASSAATADSYMYLARSPLSQRFIRENFRQMAALSEAERTLLIRNIDDIALGDPAQSLIRLNGLTHKAKSITLRQLYIQVQRYVKFVAVVAILEMLFSPQDVQAQRKLARLHSNPSLFLQASEQQLLEWEKDPQADKLCRNIAQAIDQAVSLQITPEQSKNILEAALHSDIFSQQQKSQYLLKMQTR